MPPPNQIKTTPRSKLISGDFMHQRQLGKSGPKLSAIGIGAMSFTDFYGATSEAASHAVLTNALDLGINHIDTANVYGGGLSESVIGRFLAKQGAQKTKLFHIATKAGIAVDKETGRRYFDNSPAYLQAELDASLARLGLDYVDLYYIHRRDSETPIEEVTETLAAMVKAGKIGGFGFSEIAPTSLYRAAAIHEIAAVQSEYSLSVRSPEMGLVQATAALGVSLVAFSPLGRSLLTDKPHSRATAVVSGWLKSNPRFVEPNLTANIEAGVRFRTLAAKWG
jgi:aryl-alcohol dehydrogenase-like predicted oxidoreductase